MSADAPLQSQIGFAPAPFDPAAGERLIACIDAAALPDEARALVRGVAGCSPYLAQLMARAGPRLAAIFQSPPETALAQAIDAAWRAADSDDPALQMQGLREAKSTAALTLALCEISGARSTMQAAAAYSAFADAAVGAAVRMALRKLVGKGFQPLDPERPESGSGLVVLAMGKMGAFELNYSSDVDLIVLFDSASQALGGPSQSKQLAVATAKLIVARLNDQTADGYVFRTDLRLRPDPGVSAAAVSVAAAEAYYESYGQNWERAAFIKARAAAGDIPLGEAFIKNLRPFIWRKYLDYATIDEIQAILRQIHESGGGEAIDFHGYDLKRGRGGIRQIEFFVQTQQLIVGGKDPACRGRSTLQMLEALEVSGLVAKDARRLFSQNYEYLRRVEHRIQMVNDEQTHRLPATDEETRRLAMFLGEKSPQYFKKKILHVFEATDRQASTLLTAEERPVSAAGVLNFSGVDLDQNTASTLSRLGFERPQAVAETFRRWHAGETRATRSPRARALLAKLTPQLMEALSRAGEPDAAFAAFDDFIRRLPAGVQIFSLLLNRPDIYDRLLQIMTISPYLGRELAKRAHLLEALIEVRWPEPPPQPGRFAAELAQRLAGAEDFEAAMNAVRRWASERNFSAAAQLVAGMIEVKDAAARFTAVAEAAIDGLLPAVERETQQRFGVIDGEIVVVALGRLGARQMTAASDVDLMFIYDAPEGARSSGSAALDATTYFARLVRRFLTAVASQTEEGALYEVDMQLRPSGGKGPAAVSFSAFHHYYDSSAWTWEKMALTKARVIAGGAGLGARVAREIDDIIKSPRDQAATARDVDDMRERLRASKPAASVWDIKNAVGGTTEIDFIIQYLTLAHAAGGGLRLETDPSKALAALSDAGLLTPAFLIQLSAALHDFETVSQLSRASLAGNLQNLQTEGAAGTALRQVMASAVEATSLEEAESKLAITMQGVRRIYESIVVAAATAGENAG